MRVRLLIAVFAAFLLAPIADAKENVELMSVAELEQLLARGPLDAKFKTVPEGSQLKEYDIKLKGFVSFGDIRIVVFTSKHFVVGGMSGSPVYAKGLDGKRKKVGALSYRMTDFAVGLQWGGVSPIEYMRAEAKGGLTATPVKTASFTYAGKTLVPIDTTPTASNLASSAAGRNWPLEEGMPISVDILEFTTPAGVSTTVNSTGTITHIDADGTIYAFGHPFLGARTARYNFRTCRILGTIYSYDGSNKLSGEESPVLGTIEYDGAYGIYGKIGGADQRPVTEFTADFLRDGKPTGNYQVKMATSPFTALIMGYAFELIGSVAKAPLPVQASTVAFSSAVQLEGHEPIEYSQVFTSTQFQFGPMTVRDSSYENAREKFLKDIYVPLSTHRMGFKITGARLSFDFTDGVAPSLKVASAQFPPKMKWGEDALLDLTLVSEDNSVTLHRQVKIPVDWSKVEKPTYAADTKDTDKVSEKVIGGTVVIYTAEHFDMFLTDNEKERENPPYFLDAKDYLAQFRNKLTRSNRMLYVRAALRKDSSLHETSVPAGAVELLEQPAPVPAGTDWTLERKGLAQRKVTVRREEAVWFTAPMTPVPTGYMVGRMEAIHLNFEIVN